MAIRKSFGVLMLDVEGLQLTSEDKELLARPQVGGVILGLFKRNFASITQLQDLIAEIRQCNDNLLIAVDQEGGRVQRFEQGFTRLPAMYTIGRMYQSDPAEALTLAHTTGWLMAAEILSCGLDISFAPVLDLYMETSRIIADRAFSADPLVVGKLALAFIDGMHEAGMKATGKHFPGHGSVEADSHVELPVDPRNLSQLLETDLVPFANCIKYLDAVMPGHVVYPQVDKCCAAFSSIWLQDVLRNQLGFDGVIFSDDLTMAAAGTAGPIEKRAASALAAGCDMILVCNNRQAALTVADWLQANAYPMNEKLSTMRGQGKLSRSDLLASDAWQQANATVITLES